MCVFEEEINKKNIFYLVRSFLEIDICSLLEGDRIIPLYIIHITFSMTGQAKDDLLMQVAAK